MNIKQLIFSAMQQYLPKVASVELELDRKDATLTKFSNLEIGRIKGYPVPPTVECPLTNITVGTIVRYSDKHKNAGSDTIISGLRLRDDGAIAYTTMLGVEIEAADIASIVNEACGFNIVMLGEFRKLRTLTFYLSYEENPSALKIIYRSALRKPQLTLTMMSSILSEQGFHGFVISKNKVGAHPSIDNNEDLEKAFMQNQNIERILTFDADEPDMILLNDWAAGMHDLARTRFKSAVDSVCESSIQGLTL